MVIELVVRPLDGDEYTLTADSRDLFVWEKTTGAGRGFMEAAFNEHGLPRFGPLYQVAHIAARRQQMFTGTLDEFAEQHVIEFEVQTQPDPTGPGASPGP